MNYQIKFEKIKRHWITREDSSDTDVYYSYGNGEPFWIKLGMIVDEQDYHVMFFKNTNITTDLIIALAESLKSYQR